MIRSLYTQTSSVKSYSINEGDLCYLYTHHVRSTRWTGEAYLHINVSQTLPWSELAVKGNNLPFWGLTAWFPIPAEVSALDTCSQDKLSDSMTRLGNNAVRHRPLKTLSCFIDFLSDIWFYLNFNSVFHQFFIRGFLFDIRKKNCSF